MKHFFLHYFSLIFFTLTAFFNSDFLKAEENSISNSNRIGFEHADFSFNSKFTIPQTEKSNSLEADTGLKFSFKNADFRFYESLSKVELPFSAAEFCDELKEPRYGAGIFLFKNTFPVAVKAGTNTYSKSLSKIKNPAPSSIGNPLTRSFSFSGGLGAALPTLSSSGQPLSIALSAGIVNGEDKGVFFSTAAFEAMIDEGKNSAFAISASKKLGNFSSIEAAFTGGRFFIENNSSVLKKANAAFEGDYFLSALAEIAVRTPHFKAITRTGFQESPYDSNFLWISFDGRTGFRNLLLNFACFAIPTTGKSPKVAPIIGANSTIQKTVEQASVNPQVIFQLNDKKNSMLKFGISAIESWKITSTKEAELLNVGKLRAATEFEQQQFKVRYDFTLANHLISGNPPNKTNTPEKYISNSLSSDFLIKYFKASFDFGYKYYPPYNSEYAPKRTFDASISAALVKIKNLTVKNNLSLEFKGKNRHSGSISTAVSYKIKSKKVNSSLKAEIEMPF